MKKIFILLTIIFIFLAIVFILPRGKKDKPAKTPSFIKPQPVKNTSGKLKIGNATISYEYLHDPPNDHVDATFVFATNKSAKATVSYGEGLSGKIKISETHEGYDKKHYIVIHKIEPATNFNYQITAKSKSGEKTKSERKGFLTPPHQQSDYVSSFLTNIYSAINNLLGL